MARDHGGRNMGFQDYSHSSSNGRAYGNNMGGPNNAPMQQGSAPMGANNGDWNQRDYIQSQDLFSTDSPQAMQQGSQRMDFRDDMSDPFRAPGGLGHTRSPQHANGGNRRITQEDDALMDDILGELDEDF